MKNYTVSKAVALLVAIALLFCTVCGCSSSVQSLETNSDEDINKSLYYTISSSEDIKELVTDDNKLVINYYEAYIWTVFFNEENTVDSMIFIYKFDSPEKAHSMIETRTHELERNKTMRVTNAKSVENYLVVELVDSSFDGLSRERLENNFNNLIVY